MPRWPLKSHAHPSILDSSPALHLLDRFCHCHEPVPWVIPGENLLKWIRPPTRDAGDGFTAIMQLAPSEVIFLRWHPGLGFGMAQALTRTRTTRFEILPSPDSLRVTGTALPTPFFSTMAPRTKCTSQSQTLPHPISQCAPSAHLILREDRRISNLAAVITRIVSRLRGQSVAFVCHR